VSSENDDLEELTNEIRRLIDSNKLFLERVGDEEYEDESEDGDQAESEASESAAEPGEDDYEEL
jgi:hypothetical protein